MRLYHYTDEMRATSIEELGLLPIADPELTPPGEGTEVARGVVLPNGYEVVQRAFTEPGVVWLIEGKRLDFYAAGGMLGQWKSEVCFFVDTDGLDVHHWVEWAAAQDTPAWWIDVLDRAGGGTAARWWITTDPVGPERLHRVHPGLRQ